MALLQFMFQYILLIAPFLVIIHFAYNRYHYGLRKVPGPFLASLTDLWRFFLALGRQAHVTMIDLHAKHGTVVRLGPNCVSVTDLDAVKHIYSPHTGFIKSEFYPVQQTIKKGVPIQALFNTRDEDFHLKLRRCVARAYTMSSVVHYEPSVDMVVGRFLDTLEQRFLNPDKSGNVVCDFGSYLHYFAFDVIGQLTFSKMFGFMQEGRDIDNIIRDLQKFMDYAGPVGQLPMIDRLLLKNPIRLWLSDMGFINSTSPVVTFSLKQIAERKADTAALEKAMEDCGQRNDFLISFLEAQIKNPEFMDDSRVLAITVANMFAGADTTSISMRAIFINLLQNPHCMQKLLNELDQVYAAKRAAGDLGPMTWSEAKALPYLDAVIKEALRVHPAVGLPLERIVPAEGLRIGEHYFRPGTIVGCNPWALHQESYIFGKNPELYRPERWLECSLEEKTRMEGAILTFGMGPRTCIGKNIVFLELYKIVPAVLDRFTVSFVAS
ncbi:hypothetical protein ABW19_dt0207336 [Dactylella cylindrospora]|nr:hypothetical protein ABW19_dt0207336 [Dactylella cylindrospora]